MPKMPVFEKPRFFHSALLNTSLLAVLPVLAVLFIVVMPSIFSPKINASPALSGGIWFNYRYVNSDGNANDRDSETLGDFADEAFILYVDDKPENSPWSLSAELRIGPGSFTSPANNSTGDNAVLHKAWVRYAIDEASSVTFGKSQVPFGWKTGNFWPGEILLGGYGDQMDVGAKYSIARSTAQYTLAYYHADDWGETSTDTVDDNGHWGRADSYRKIQTFVADGSWAMTEQHRLGLSLQAGKLQDLSAPENEADGNHEGAVLYMVGDYGAAGFKAQWLQIQRDLPTAFAQQQNLTATIKNQRAAIELTYARNNWLYYLDTTWAKTQTNGNSAGSVYGFAPGFSYDYGPGWVYVEYLKQNGFIDSLGDVGEGDFDAAYVSFDYYF